MHDARQPVHEEAAPKAERSSPHNGHSWLCTFGIFVAIRSTHHLSVEGPDALCGDVAVEAEVRPARQVLCHAMVRDISHHEIRLCPGVVRGSHTQAANPTLHHVAVCQCGQGQQKAGILNKEQGAKLSASRLPHVKAAHQHDVNESLVQRRTEVAEPVDALHGPARAHFREPAHLQAAAASSSRPVASHSMERVVPCQHDSRPGLLICRQDLTGSFFDEKSKLSSYLSLPCGRRGPVKSRCPVTAQCPRRCGGRRSRCPPEPSPPRRTARAMPVAARRPQHLEDHFRSIWQLCGLHQCMAAAGIFACPSANTV